MQRKYIVLFETLMCFDDIELQLSESQQQSLADCDDLSSFLFCHQLVKVCVPAMFIQIRQQTHVLLWHFMVKPRGTSRQVPTWWMKMTYPGLLASTLGGFAIKKTPKTWLFGKMVGRDEIPHT